MLDKDNLAREIRIEGEVEGDVLVASGTQLTVDVNACVHGNIRVGSNASANIEGEVQGEIVAEGSVRIAPNVVVHGGILTPTS
jgi:cytoskeletal protein CcmA (bactofilin family)